VLRYNQCYTLTTVGGWGPIQVVSANASRGCGMYDNPARAGGEQSSCIITVVSRYCLHFCTALVFSGFDAKEPRWPVSLPIHSPLYHTSGHDHFSRYISLQRVLLHIGDSDSKGITNFLQTLGKIHHRLHTPVQRLEILLEIFEAYICLGVIREGRTV